MVSRKKNKGRERKAKKEENKKAERHSRWERFARGEDENNRKVIHCYHGCTVEIPDSLDHPVICFMDDYFATGDWLKCLNSHAKLWSNDTYRNMTMNLLLRIGANLLLGSDSQIHGDSTIASTNAAQITCAIVVLDNCNEMKSMSEVLLTRCVSTKIMDIRGGNMRDLLKFYSKRLSCSCLKKMHSEARKTLPKVGMCYNCCEVKERALLSVCSRCRINHYCSRECQVADWPKHEDFCDDHVRVHNHYSFKELTIQATHPSEERAELEEAEADLADFQRLMEKKRMAEKAQHEAGEKAKSEREQHEHALTAERDKAKSEREQDRQNESADNGTGVLCSIQ